MSIPNGYDKIALVKLVRDRIGCSLKEAKDAVEEAEGNLDLAVRIAFQNRRLTQSNGQPESCEKKTLSFTIAYEGAMICLHKTKSKGSCNSCGRPDKLIRADLILANGQVGSAHVCPRCIRVVSGYMDLIAAFIANRKLPDTSS